MRRLADFVDVIAGLAILAFMVGCPLVIVAIWLSR